MADSEWSEFYEATKDDPHWGLVERAVTLAGRPGRALELGCGAGKDTRYLLAQGWHVTAVDAEAKAIQLVRRLGKEKLTAIQSRFEDFDFEAGAYDLVTAQFALPFIAPGRFLEVWARIKGAIRPGGWFCGQFFGIHDEWNRPGAGMTFLTRQQVDDLIGDMLVIEFKEEEHMGGTATGGQKRWHVFHVIARK